MKAKRKNADITEAMMKEIRDIKKNIRRKERHIMRQKYITKKSPQFIFFTVALFMILYPMDDTSLSMKLYAK